MTATTTMTQTFTEPYSTVSAPGKRILFALCRSPKKFLEEARVGADERDEQRSASRPPPRATSFLKYVSPSASIGAAT